MKGCLKIIVIAVIVLIISDFAFDILDRIQGFLDKIPWWLWVIGVIVGLYFMAKNSE